MHICTNCEQYLLKAMEENTKSSSSLKCILLPSLDNQGINSKNEISTCCDVKHYRIRRVKSKGAILVLVVSSLMTNTIYFFATVGVHTTKYQVCLIPFSVTTALAGWLTDAFIGRYKMIRFSVWITWFLITAVTVGDVVGQLNETYCHYNEIVRPILFWLVSIGLGGFQANIVQFGLDQLPDASTTEITSFIVWYVSSLISAGFIINFNFYCLNEIYVLLLICACLTLALTLLICCNHWLIKEPATQSPLKLIYKVIKFAAVTKHPQCRSAFTYCEDELPSRIDFGKSKYGGPFTTEQVEDVKTFLRLIPLIFIFAVIGDVFFAANVLYDNLEKVNNRFRINHNHELDSRKVIAECYAETGLTNSVHLGVTLLIVLNEFVLYPIFQCCIYCSRIKSLWKIITGIALQTLRVTSLMVLDAISQHNNLKDNKHNVSIQCTLFETHDLLSQTLSYQWLAIPEYLNFTSLVFLFTGVIEFICSQVPYSMKGIVIGAQYTLGLVCSIPLIIVTFLMVKYDISIKGNRIIGCDFWYLLICLAANLFNFFILTWMAKRYKLRKREDLLPNEHFFAERYYSQ